MSDVRLALRSLWKSPGLAAVVVLSLALGIGATTTVLCWMENLMYRPLRGVANQDRLVVLTTQHGDRHWDTVSLLDLRDMAASTDLFEGICGSQQTPACLTVDQRPEWIYGQIVTANFFEVLAVKPLLGRTFRLEEDEKPGGHPVLVISEQLWRRRFGADPEVLGRVVELNQHAFTVIGVTPEVFRGDVAGLRCDFWAPVMMHREVAYAGTDAQQVLQRYSRWLHTHGRLRAGVSIEQAQAALAHLATQLETAYPETNRNIRFHVHPLWNATYGAQKIFRPVFALLLVVSAAVLLIVSANVANLLLARSVTRQKEIAIRLAMGATRRRLVRQLLSESLVLAVFGGALGVLVAVWMVDLFPHFLPPTPLPIELEQPLSMRTLGLALVITLGSGLVFGLVPALQASRPALQPALKEGGRSSGGGGHRRARHALVVAEVALASTLLIAAALCLQGLQRSRQVDPGLDPRGVLLAGLRVGMNGYTRDTAADFYRQLRERLSLTPGIESAALANWFPLGFEDTGTVNLNIPGYTLAPGEALNFRHAIVSPGYFATLKIPLLAGRDFKDTDLPDAPLVVIVNETLAQRFWPGQEVLGRTLTVDGRDMTVVGVAKAGKYRALNDPPECFLYRPASQARWAMDLSLCVRGSAVGADGHLLDAASLAGLVREAIHAVDPRVEIWTSLPMSAYAEAALLSPKIASRLLVLLGALALALAAMGVYAVISYAVSQRLPEFGVRQALGASPGDVLRLVLRQGLLLALTGGLVGIALALPVTRLLSGFLYGVSPFDPLAFALAPLLLILTALIAAYLPARRATRVSPLTALRAE